MTTRWPKGGSVEKWDGKEKKKKSDGRRCRCHCIRGVRGRRREGRLRGLAVVTMPVPRGLVGVEGDDGIEK